jgi:hypothetical protein
MHLIALFMISCTQKVYHKKNLYLEMVVSNIHLRNILIYFWVVFSGLKELFEA